MVRPSAAPSGHLARVRLTALSVPDTRGNTLGELCAIWKEKLAPWLMPAQIRHIESFGPSALSMKARFTRLLSRHVALSQTGWQDNLDRDREGRSFFADSKTPAAFTYGKDALFCATASGIHNPYALALDAEYIPEHPDMDMIAFLTKLFPSMRNDPRFLDSRLLVALWVAFECVYKIAGWKFPEIDLPASFPHVFPASGSMDLRLSGSRLHFHFIISGFHMIGLASTGDFFRDISCKWSSVPALPD